MPQDLGLSFTPPQRVQTPRGPRLISRAVPTPAFWKAWRGSRESLRDLGYAPFKDSAGQWWVNRWFTENNAPAPEVEGYDIRNQQLLYPYQVQNAGRLCAALHKFDSALDASDTGTGKTYTALAVARELGLTPAIVCPKSVIASWHRVCMLFKIMPLFVTNYENCKTKKFPHVSWLMDDTPKWRVPEKTLFIFDEAHRCKGEYTQNAKLLIAAKGYKVLLLSATIASTPREMRAMGYLLGLHKLEDFRVWSVDHGCYVNEFSKWVCADAKDAMGKISQEIFPAHGGRVRIADLGDAFPETQITADIYDIENSEEQNKQYEKLLSEIAKLKVRKLTNLQAAILPLNLRYRQLAEGFKVPLLVSLANDYLENGLSVVIFTNFHDTLSQLQEQLKGSRVVHGQQTGEERQAAIDAFQADKANVIIVNIQAGGVGVSLHDTRGERPRVALLCPTYSAIHLKQALGRVHRAGAKSKSLQRIIYARGTIEEAVCKTVARKLDNIATLNDGDILEPGISV